jgi:hypothetical protein
MHRREREAEKVVAPEPNRRTLTHLFARWNGGSEQIWAGLPEIEVDEALHRVEAGSAVRVPPDAPHRIFNCGRGRMRVFCAASPAFDREAFSAAHGLERSER